MAEFTHFNESGRARMVDISAKGSTERLATAQARVFLLPETLQKIQRGKIAKGDVLGCCSSGRRDGCQEDAGPHSHVPSDSPDECRYLFQGGVSAESRRPLLHHHYSDCQDDGTDGGRNGSDDGSVGRGVDHLRYVQSCGSRDEFWRGLSPFKVRWEVRNCIPGMVEASGRAR